MADKIVTSLSSPAYTAAQGTSHGFILLHSVTAFPNNADVDKPEHAYESEKLLEELKDLGVAKFQMKHVTVSPAMNRILERCPLPVIIRDSLVRNDIETLLSLPDCFGVATNFYEGKNVLRGVTMNGPGMSEFCARFIDDTGKPVTNFTITCN